MALSATSMMGGLGGGVRKPISGYGNLMNPTYGAPAPAPAPAPTMGARATTTPTATQQANRQRAAAGQPGQFTTSGAYQVLGGSGSSIPTGGQRAAIGGGTPAQQYIQGGAGGGGGIADFAAMFGMGGASGAGGAGGAGGFPGVPGGNVTLTAERSPDLDRQQQMFEQRMSQLNAQGAKVDQNLQFQIDEYKKRLGDGPTTRSIERSASAIRDQMAGMMSDAATAGAQTGRGPGFQAGAIGEAGQRALAGASADISLGRERDLDNLLLGGQGIMEAPGKRQLAYDTLGSEFFGQGPYRAQAEHGLAEKKLGLDAYLGTGDLGIRKYAADRQAMGSPLDWFRTLYGA